MESRNLHRRVLILALALFAALLALTVVHGAAAAESVDRIQAKVKDAQDELEDARESEKEANDDISDNLRQQKRAAGKELDRLKNRAIELGKAAAKARDKRIEAEAELARKRSDLRTKASEVAEDEVEADGDVTKRVANAREAFDAWKGALGEVPAMPPLTDISNLDDEEAEAVREDDMKRLRNYVAWCEKEDKRLDDEISRAVTISTNESIKAVEDGKKLGKDAGELKKTLESRQADVKQASKDASRLVDKMKKS